jgi:hypothetical protein
MSATATRKTIDTSRFFVPCGRASTMLQWKPRFYAVLTLAALAVAAFGGYAGDAGDTLRQFGW